MTLPLDRRTFLASVAVTAAAPVLLPSTQGQTAPTKTPPAPAAASTDGPFTLPPLPFAAEALEPAIDAETMRLHHGKHHQAYVTNLNAAVKGLSLPAHVEELIAKLDSVPQEKRAAVRNQGGGHANHTLFWSVLAPKGSGGDASKELVTALDRDLGGLEKAKTDLAAGGLARFGSGWSWLVVTGDRKLALTTTPNQDSPLMGAAVLERGSLAGTPIFGIDVWEHAYYLKYQNRRADYLKAIWDVVNWREVSRRFAAAVS